MLNVIDIELIVQALESAASYERALDRTDTHHKEIIRYLRSRDITGGLRFVEESAAVKTPSHLMTCICERRVIIYEGEYTADCDCGVSHVVIGDGHMTEKR